MIDQFLYQYLSNNVGWHFVCAKINQPKIEPEPLCGEMNQNMGTMGLQQKQLCFKDMLAFCLIFLEKYWIFEYNLAISLDQEKNGHI